MQSLNKVYLKLNYVSLCLTHSHSSSQTEMKKKLISKNKNLKYEKVYKKHISKVKHPGNIMITILVMQNNKIKLPETQIK